MHTNLAARYGVGINASGDSSLGALLSDVLRLLRQDFAKRAAGTHLTPALCRLLFQVARDEGARQTKLAERMEMTPVTVGRMIDRLEKQGLVRRIVDQNDRRAVRVLLGCDAAGFLDHLRQIARASEEYALRDLEEDERMALSRALERVRLNLRPE